MNPKDDRSEVSKFEAVVKTLLSVSHEEIKKRDEEWHRKKAQKKMAKTSPTKAKS